MTTNIAKLRQGKKLIEVDLPLDTINENISAEPVGSRGHPWTIQQWWARRKLTACRVVIFASMVDDPSSYLEHPDEVSKERQYLHNLMERLSLWRNSQDENLLEEARYEIARSIARQRGETAPTRPDEVLAYLGDPAKNLNIYDPFSGGGCIPLEAQRLGLRVTGTDLNPVAVLLTKALIELPQKHANHPPKNPDANIWVTAPGRRSSGKQITWQGSSGLASDIRYYGRRMREMAYERIGHLYPNIRMPNGKEATVIGWL